MKKADNFNPGKWLVENKITTQSRIKEVSQEFGILQDKPLDYVLVVYDITDESDPNPPMKMIFTSDSEENLMMSKYDLFQIIQDIDSKISEDDFETEGPMPSDEFKSRYGYSIPRNLLYVI